jgi:serine protease Do
MSGLPGFLRFRVVSTLAGLFIGIAPAATLVRAEGPATAPTTKPAAITTKPAKPATRPIKPLTLSALATPISSSPSSVAELQQIEKRVEAVSSKVMPAVVGVIVGSGQGSGVIVSQDGYVLTAAHVSEKPDQEVQIVLADGRKVKAKTLGVNKQIDSGLMKIEESGDWPYCEIGKSGELKKGQWVLALGHPGGYRKDRPPVVRLGRVLSSTGPNEFIMTDCTLVGGDSGGPLFDLDGKVVGIHSRIGPSTLNNMHVPADTYTATWDRLAKGESWGDRFSFLGGGPTVRGPLLGVGGESVTGGGVKITNVTAGGPGDKAGLKSGDVVKTFDGISVKSIDHLAVMIARKKPGDKVAIIVDRAGKRVDLNATLIARPKDSP